MVRVKVVRRGKRRYLRAALVKRMRVRRAISNPSPTFVETFALPRDNLTLVANGSGTGKYFKVRIQDVPQVAQYANLYTQYRINWVKVMLLPQYNTLNSDINAATFNQSSALTSAGMARIVYSIQDSPGQTDPASENEVLEDNGCKVKPFGAKWSCSFKPVPDINQNVTGGTIIPIRNKTRQWFNFDTAAPANNPYHGGVKAFITLPGTTSDGGSMVLVAYYKVSFSLRDPQ